MRRLLPAAAFVLAACAGNPAPTPHPSSVLGPRSSDLAELRHDIEIAQSQVVQEQQKSVAEVPHVDLEAAVSIPVPQHRTIDSALSLFTGEMHDDIQTSLTRSARYRKMIDAALHEYRLPKGLAYLPVIESAYVPFNTSRSGAYGIWQFMPDTAREYGLRIDWWIDERADPEKSTQAAAAYLSDLYREFNDWSLALAAYNCGAGRIHRAMESTGSTSYWELLEQSAIPRETRGYVPTFYATLLIATDPPTYGFRLGDPIERAEKQVAVEGPVSLAYIAEVAGVDRDELIAMNPSLRRAVVPPGRNTIVVPAHAAPLVAERASTLKNDDTHIAICTFKLREGDTLKKIAKKLGTDRDTLMAMNHIRSANSVGEGDTIYLPVRARDLGALLHGIQYVVRKGDTMYSIAKRHGLSVDELREYNDLPQHAKLHPGQQLRVVAPRPVTAGN